MVEIYRNSFIYKILSLISVGWQQSLIRKALVNNTSDERVENSFVFRLLNGFLAFFTKKSNLVKCDVVSESFFVSKITYFKNQAAKAFKTSITGWLFESFTDWNIGCKDIKLYTTFTFVLLFAAPIIPTMICAVIAFSALILFGIDRLKTNKLQKNADSLEFLIILLAFIFGLYAIFSLTPQKSIQIWLIYLIFMMSYFLIKDSANTQDKLFKFAAIIVFSGFFVSLYGIYQRFFGSNIGHAWLDEEMFGDIALRVYSTLENPNVLGEFLLLVIPVCAAILWTRKKLLPRIFYGGVLATMLLCMLFTQSRGCWLGLILAVAVFAALNDKRLVILGLAAIAIMPFVLPSSVIARFTSIGNVNDSSTSYRLFIWYGTINMLRDFGIYGIGLGSDAFNKIYPFYSYSAVHAPHSHNLYLQLLCETGIVGLLTFIIIVIIALKKMLLGHFVKKDTFPAVLSTAVTAGVLGFMLQGAFDYVWYNYRVFLIFWMMLAIGASAARLQKKQEV
ncbi:MAG: O-antigen ligase family protein [Firmicutes bacterium]|nr:O-antigen ligase family protein [Bacillota bacterium]